MWRCYQLCRAFPLLHQGWRGGGANLFLLELHGAKLKTASKCLNTFIRGCRLFCGGSEKSRFQWLHKEQFQNFLELYERGRNYCFFDKVLILLGNRSRSERIRGFNWNNYSRIPIFRTLIFFEPPDTSKQKSFWFGFDLISLFHFHLTNMNTNI